LQASFARVWPFFFVGKIAPISGMYPSFILSSQHPKTLTLKLQTI
jgi:hypothetical protein